VQFERWNIRCWRRARHNVTSSVELKYRPNCAGAETEANVSHGKGESGSAALPLTAAVLDVLSFLLFTVRITISGSSRARDIAHPTPYRWSGNARARQPERDGPGKTHEKMLCKRNALRFDFLRHRGFWAGSFRAAQGELPVARLHDQPPIQIAG